MKIPQSFLDGNAIANELLPTIARAEKKTEVILEFWAGLIGQQLGYMAAAVGREKSLQLLDILRKQIDVATADMDVNKRRKIKVSLSIVKTNASDIDGVDP